MKLLEPGTEIDGFIVGDCVHAGGMAHIYRAGYAQSGHDPGFELAMKVPRMTSGYTENQLYRQLDITSYGFSPYTATAEEGSTEHGGYHEALIGLGWVLGPSAGVAAQSLYPAQVWAGVAAVGAVPVPEPLSPPHAASRTSAARANMMSQAR